MSKVGTYLQEHIAGEVILNPQIREAISRDGSVLKITPEMVIFPKTTNDIRKVTRFSSQLSERGHTMPVTARGGGTDQTGAAIGSGIVVSLTAHMNRVFEYEPKRRLVRVQPGASNSTLIEALGLNGLDIPAISLRDRTGTIGGAVANNSGSELSGKYGKISNYVDQLEVVLSNGDVIQTGRISKRELNRKKGLETFEGDIYRGIDNLIEDNKDIIDELAARQQETNVGYMGIASVKLRDGSFDLTPLLVGSQGTLGIISEMILRAKDLSKSPTVVQVIFNNRDEARDKAEEFLSLKPAFMEFFDKELFRIAEKEGKRFSSLSDCDENYQAVLLIGFDDESDRRRNSKVKKLKKMLEGADARTKESDDDNTSDLLGIRTALAWSQFDGTRGEAAVPFLGGVYISREKLGIFETGLEVLESKYHQAFPVYGDETSSIYYVMPSIDLRKVGDKQKIFKILNDFAKLVDKVEGELVGESGEGRLKGAISQALLDSETRQLFSDIKAVFDPRGILNPGVKQALDIKSLATMIQSTHTSPGLPNYLPYH